MRSRRRESRSTASLIGCDPPTSSMKASDLGISSMRVRRLLASWEVLESELFDGVVVRCGHDQGVALRQALKKPRAMALCPRWLCAACDLVDHDEQALLVSDLRALQRLEVTGEGGVCGAVVGGVADHRRDGVRRRR